MEKDFRDFLKQVLSKSLYNAAQERYDKAAVKRPELTEKGKTEYLKEAWRLAEKYGELSVKQLEQIPIRSPEDMSNPALKSSIEQKLKSVEARMEKELSPS